MEMFENYPKIRPVLSSEYAEIYEEHYKNNRNGATTASSISQRMESWLHRKVARDAAVHLSTLEIGAGNLNQLQYEPIGSEYDIVEPFKVLFENSDRIKQIRTIYNLIEDVPLTNKYDRITSCAVFEHIDNLPYVVSKAGLLLREGGCLRTAIPSEGGHLWKIGYKLTTGLEFKLKYKLDYSVIMKHEHLNEAHEIQRIIKYFFEDVSSSRLGFGKHFSLYTFLAARNPRFDRCNEYCKRMEEIL